MYSLTSSHFHCYRKPTVVPSSTWKIGPRGWQFLLSLLACSGLVVVVLPVEFSQADENSVSATRPPLPRQLAPNENYSSSAVCQKCHFKEYQSWHHSFHRTMTQVASPTNFVGKFDGTQIKAYGLKYRVFMRDGQFWAEMPDPDEMINRQRTFELRRASGGTYENLNWEGISQVERQVVMSTGSHNYQTYWVESAKYPGTLMTLPLVFLIADKQWIPREEAFMYPPGPRRMVTVWNDHCINCHSTGPAPRPYGINAPVTRRVVETGFHTQVGEVGIACEVCHGPAAEHVRLRKAEAAGDTSITPAQLTNDPIVQPALLNDHRRATYVCGQCHGVYVRTGEFGTRFRDQGTDFIPGEDLLAKRHYIFPPWDAATYPDEASHARAVEEFERNRNFFRERFWDNGQVLAGGREFTAISMSKCFTKGSISCLSCHSMHQSDPDDQLKQGMETSAACTQCHKEAQYTEDITQHTHHKANSTGSDCLNCHMPRTTYALFKAIRSHQIAAPDLAGSINHGVPNACNLCHLDQPLGWTQEHLANWYGYSRQKLTVEQQQVSAAIVWLLTGDAAQRVITVWHVGWKPAQEVSDADWLAPFVAKLIDDPYGVVRYVAKRSLATLPHFEGFKVDFRASADELHATSQAIIREWQQQQNGPPSRTGPRVLINGDGKLAEPPIQWLLDHRNNRPVTIKE